MRTIARVPAPAGRERDGSRIRRGELEVFEMLLEELGAGVIAVTGAGDGRRTVSTGLAGAAAAGGERAALVECDLSEPVLAEALGLAQGPGLGEYLARQAEAPEILQPLVLAGPAGGRAAHPLVCIVAGQRAGDSAASLDLEGFRRVLANLRGAYGVVVLHAPPIADRSGTLSSAAAEADALLACVGPKLAVGRSGRTLRRALSRIPARRTEIVVYG